MTLDELFELENISVRALNVCYGRGLRSLSDILNFFKEHNTFIHLRNCGNKSNNKLIEFCLKYIDQEDDYSNKGNYNSNNQILEKDILKSRISNLTRTQRDIINSYIDISTISLSARSRNALLNILNNNIDLRIISEEILFNDQFNVSEIKNVGRQSSLELEEFVSNLVSFIDKITETTNYSELFSLKNEYLIKQCFQISDIPSDVLETKSFFKITDFIIKQNVIFEKNQNTIFLKGLKIYKDQHVLNIENIAADIQLSRERVRQIRALILKDLANRFQFIKNTEEDIFQNYKIDLTEDLLIVDDDFCNFINKCYDVSFSKEFIAFLLSVYTSEEFQLVGKTEDILISKENKSSEKFSWTYYYLINRYLWLTFDFNAFINNVKKRLTERIDKSYSLNFKGYLMNFILIYDYKILSKIASVAELIINLEFDIFIDISDNINFERNTIKQVPEYVIEVLEKLGVPTNIEDLYNIIEDEYPGVTKSQDALRGSIQRASEIIYFGRSSTYGLKKWETEHDGIKGGTIRKIVIDYLKEKDYPIHIYEILNEVNRYRKTNARNVLTNLQLDNQKQFLIFSQNFIGLSNKIYNSNLTSLPKFLGKTIKTYIIQNGPISRQLAETHFSNVLGIDLINTSHIIQMLIDNKYINTTKQDNLYI